MRILVVTLYSGENELNESINSVKSQKGLDIKHEVIENLPKQLAHQNLYRIFNDNRDKYDYFAKLDADMKFSHPNSLSNILRNFSSDVDVLSCTVHDGITNMDMQSFNVFSSRCKFQPENNDALFTDRVEIDYPGKHLSYVDAERNVLHAFNPSDFQAFMFGVHRALKVMQYGSYLLRIENAYHQKRILWNAYRNYIDNKSQPALKALIGASLVFEGHIKNRHLYIKDDYFVFFDEVSQFSLDCVNSRLKEEPNMLSLCRLLGVGRFLLSAIYYSRRKIKFV